MGAVVLQVHRDAAGTQRQKTLLFVNPSLTLSAEVRNHLRRVVDAVLLSKVHIL